MKKCVLVCALLACTVAATNASAQIVANTVKRAGIGGSVGGYFTFDDEVNVGPAYGVNFGLAPAPGFGPSIGFGWYEGDLISVSYTHLRAHETGRNLVCRLLLEKK